MSTVLEEKKRLVAKILEAEIKFRERFGSKWYSKQYDSGGVGVRTALDWGERKGQFAFIVSSEAVQDDYPSQMLLTDCMTEDLLKWSDRIPDFWVYCETEEVKDVKPYRDQISKLQDWLATLK